MSRTLIKNIGTLISGNIRNPKINADSILIVDGKISAIGPVSELADGVDSVIDA